LQPTGFEILIILYRADPYTTMFLRIAWLIYTLRAGINTSQAIARLDRPMVTGAIQEKNPALRHETGRTAGGDNRGRKIDRPRNWVY
jgi:hypothetical protein